MRRKEVTGEASLAIVIRVGKRSQTYVLKRIEAYQEASPAWRLTKAGKPSEQYTVALLPHGAECTCPDFVWCRDGVDAKGCKHIAALRTVGLLTKETRHGQANSVEV